LIHTADFGIQSPPPRHSAAPANVKSTVMQAREQWKSRTGFILAAAGSAVGLGNA